LEGVDWDCRRIEYARLTIWVCETREDVYLRSDLRSFDVLPDRVTGPAGDAFCLVPALAVRVPSDGFRLSAFRAGGLLRVVECEREPPI
jgi:hypothetical protein